MQQHNDAIVLQPIGHVSAREGRFALQLAPGAAAGLQGLEGFGHLQVLWWASGCAGATHRALRTLPKPYRTAPDTLGVFATCSPARPNPIGLSAVAVTGVEAAAGLVHLAWIDAEDGTPVLDVKPYLPGADRVETPGLPHWCAHWPASVEASAAFDWEAEFNF